jgi:hypothetical protein
MLYLPLSPFSVRPEALILVCSFQQHGAIRTTLSGPEDYDNDDASGFQRIEAREIDTIGIDYCPLRKDHSQPIFSLKVRTALSRRSGTQWATTPSIFPST